jgi:ribonuclease P protein component
MEEYPRAKRITRRSELLRLIKEGEQLRTGDLEVRSAASPFGYGRAGLIVPRFGHTAVKRNRLKRRLRDLLRRELLPAAISSDVVIRCRPSAYTCSYDDLRGQILAIRQRIARAETGRTET